MFNFFRKKTAKRNQNGLSNETCETPENRTNNKIIHPRDQRKARECETVQQVPLNKCSRNTGEIDDTNISRSNDIAVITPRPGDPDVFKNENEKEKLVREKNHVYDKGGSDNAKSDSVKTKYSGHCPPCGSNGVVKNTPTDSDTNVELKNDPKTKPHTCLSDNNTQNALANSDGSSDLFKESCINKEVKTGKEVINLLLPETSLQYRREETNIAKTGVQCLLDIMAGGRKKKNKAPKRPNVTDNRRSWSINSQQKTKTNPAEATDRAEDAEEKSCIRTELRRSSSVPATNVASSIDDNVKETDPVDDRVTDAACLPDGAEKIGRAETPADAPDGRTFRGERGATDETSNAVTSKPLGNVANAVGSEIEHGGSAGQSSCVVAKCDTGQTSDDSPADFVKSLILEKYKNNRQSPRYSYVTQENVVNSSQIDAHSCVEPLIESNKSIEAEEQINKQTIKRIPQFDCKENCPLNVPSDNKTNIMGAAESRSGEGGKGGDKKDNSVQKVENLAAVTDYVLDECGGTREMTITRPVTQPELAETVFEKSQVSLDASLDANEVHSATARKDTNEHSVEFINETDSVGISETNEMFEQPSGEDKRLKNILKETAELGEAKGTVRKHVTFHRIIHFDDGDNLNEVSSDEDSVVEESFASLDDEDAGEDIDFDLNKADNDEVPYPEGDDTQTKENDSISMADTQGIQGNDSAIDISFDSGESVVKGKSCNESEEHFEDVESEILEVENNENLGLESSSEEIDQSVSEATKDDTFNKIIEVKEDGTDEEDEVEEQDETSEGSTSGESETDESSDVNSCDVKNQKVIFDSEKVLEEVRKQEMVWEVAETKEDDSAYAELLRVVEKQLMRGLAGQEGRLADLQERAAALHRVQSEVCSARKEAELVRQKLHHVEGDLSATRARNSQLVELLETKAEEVRQVERRADELGEEVVRLQHKLDQIQPEKDCLKQTIEKLKREKEQEKKTYEEALARELEQRAERERSWRVEFEKLRSQGAESEEMLLADCEWKLRDVQRSAAERCARAENRLKELQLTTDQKCEAADKKVAEMRAEMASLRATSLEQQRELRQNAQQAGVLEAARNTLETEAKRLRTLLSMEKDKAEVAKAQHAKELDEKEQRLVIRLAEEARRAELLGRQQRRTEECLQHDKALREASNKIEELKATLMKKEAQFTESLQKAESRSDWQVYELRRSLDKAEFKYTETLEKLQEQYAEDTERLAEESEKRAKELENALSAQACSSRATLELVKGQLQADHAEAMQRIKEQHRLEMEKQWDLFTADKEQCLERMKAECLMEGEEEREKRDKQLLQDIDELKHELATREGDVGTLRIEAKKANDARASAERRLSEVQAACNAREIAVRSESARQAETEKKEARDTIEHLTKKCACLTNLFEDMRSRWQQAPGEAAQLRKALQDEKARAQALRRQLDALSRPYEPHKWHVK